MDSRIVNKPFARVRVFDIDFDDIERTLSMVENTASNYGAILPGAPKSDDIIRVELLQAGVEVVGGSFPQPVVNRKPANGRPRKARRSCDGRYPAEGSRTKRL